tara:strand:+ start:290 stop:544 length:255 start_codon:yes stop_codon:yes gene_type:complete
MLKNIQKEVEDLRVKVYSGQSNEDTEKALYEIEQLLFKAMDKQLILSGVSNLVCDNCRTRPLEWVDQGKKYLKCKCGKVKQTCC